MDRIEVALMISMGLAMISALLLDILSISTGLSSAILLILGIVLLMKNWWEILEESQK
jgi:hypothetical protein